MHDGLIDCFLADHQELLCPHAAAVRLSGGLVCFPSVGRAGESTLCAELVASGGVRFGDDVLPVDPETRVAQALSLPLLLRKPWPSSLSPAARKLIERRAGPTSEGWSYLALGPDEIAPLGAREPVAAFLMLDRRKKGAAVLTRIDPADVAEKLILQNLVRNGSSHRLLDCAAGLAETRGGLRRFS